MERVESAMFQKRAVSGLSGMLGELMELARHEVGQEERKLTQFDVVELIAKLCEGNQPFAIERSQLSRRGYDLPRRLSTQLPLHASSEIEVAEKEWRTLGLSRMRATCVRRVTQPLPLSHLGLLLPHEKADPP